MRLIVLALFLTGCNCASIKCEEKPQPDGECCTECFDHGVLTIRSRKHTCP